MEQEQIIGTIGAKEMGRLESPFFTGDVVKQIVKGRMTLTYHDAGRIGFSTPRTMTPKEKLMSMAARTAASVVASAAVELPVDGELDGKPVTIIGMRASDFDDRMVVLTIL